MMPNNHRPAIKFLKATAADILSGAKTLEPRPRSLVWIKRLQGAKTVELTYGPRMGAPTVFAVAIIEKIEVRPFDTITMTDLKRISPQWQHRTAAEFIQAYSDWYAKELQKGYPVAWIYFHLI